MEEKFALITGTSSGIGLEMALSMLEDQYTVIGVSRSGSNIDHPNYIDILCDITDEASVEEMYRLVEENTDKLNVIVLNAGIFQMSPLVETSTKEFTDQLHTNVVGAFHILKHSFDFLIEDETHIITVSSVASKYGLANIAAYSASKFALNGMIESLKAEWAAFGVRFSTLMPGAVNTGLWDTEDGEEVEFPRNQMMEVADVLHVFNMVLNSSRMVQFPEIVFLHKQGIVK